MKIDVTLFFLGELKRRGNKLAKRILRWFERHERNGIILQYGIFWFGTIPQRYGIPDYIKQAVCRFMDRHYHAQYIEYLLPPAA